MLTPRWESLNPRDASVLVVDDNDDDLRVISRALQNFGIRRMWAASTGEEAVEWARKQPSDVVITDFGLPGMNGLRVLELITEMSPDTRVIVMTGLGDERTAVSAMKLGASDYIPKDSLLTSGLVTSLQAALRAKIGARVDQVSRTLEQGSNRLEVAEAEADWLILNNVERHGYRASEPAVADEDDDDVAHVREMLCRYLELRGLGFQGPTSKEEEGLVTAFISRGMSAQAMLVMYRSSIRTMRERLDGTTLAVSPTASFVRVLSRVIEEYQCAISMASVSPARAA